MIGQTIYTDRAFRAAFAIACAALTTRFLFHLSRM